MIDNEEQQLYLSVWKSNPDGEQKFSNYLKDNYQHVTVNKIARELNVIEYIVSRKVESSKFP